MTPQRRSPLLGEAGRFVVPATAASLTSGCSTSPAQDVLGSYFPAWMLCALAGIGVALLCRQLLAVLGLGRDLPLAPLAYLCVAVASSMAVWLLRFGG